MSEAAGQNNPMHGVTLERMLTEMERDIGWPAMADHVPIRCFQSEPSIASSLKFLRRTPWAREKVERLWLAMQRKAKRAAQRATDAR